MDNAMAASTGRDGTFTTPRVASPSVILWATVNAVMVFTSIQGPFTMSSRPSTNSR